MRIIDPSLDDRLDLVEAIWDSTAAEQDALPVTPEQRRELDCRLAAYRLDGNRGRHRWQGGSGFSPETSQPAP